MNPIPRVYWYEKRTPEMHALDADMEVDAVVVGAGMAGLTVADHLSRAGLTVAIVERLFAGGGASGKSSGFITPDSELELGDLITRYGPKRAKKLWEFVLGGVEEIRRNIL
ncbi:FAD-dependent oxidoreductase, partial [bacterium]|nr:FAD-dependent oxidoreductase [bacterium]